MKTVNYCRLKTGKSLLMGTSINVQCRSVAYYMRATVVTVMIFSGYIKHQISKWEGSECSLGEGESILGSSCRSIKEVVTESGTGPGERAELRSCAL